MKWLHVIVTSMINGLLQTTLCIVKESENKCLSTSHEIPTYSRTIYIKDSKLWKWISRNNVLEYGMEDEWEILSGNGNGRDLFNWTLNFVLGKNPGDFSENNPTLKSKSLENRNKLVYVYQSPLIYWKCYTWFIQLLFLLTLNLHDAIVPPLPRVLLSRGHCILGNWNTCF